MKICAFSDMHGQYDFQIDPCDIVLICGDIVPLNIQWNMNKSLEWFKTFFFPWCTNLPCEKVLFVAGNHDKFLKEITTEVRDILKGQDKVVYLECETYEYQGKVIYGSPICKIFGKWSFMESYEEQKERYERHLQIIGKVDVIMSHDCPYGINDVLLQKDCFWADGGHIGNQALRDFLDAASPSLMVTGHLHSAEHNKIQHGKTAVYNVSLLNENYEMAYKPLYVSLD